MSAPNAFERSHIVIDGLAALDAAIQAGANPWDEYETSFGGVTEERDEPLPSDERRALYLATVQDVRERAEATL